MPTASSKLSNNLASTVVAEAANDRKVTKVTCGKWAEPRARNFRAGRDSY